MTLKRALLCVNCQSTSHRRCCARCGRAPSGGQYCSRQCAEAQGLEDAASAQLEADEADANTRTITLRMTVRQARQLRAALSVAVNYYEGSEFEDGAEFEQLKAELGPVIHAAINPKDD